jgi:hypothetical protein
LICALAANSAGGGKTLDSIRTDSIAFVSVSVIFYVLNFGLFNSSDYPFSIARIQIKISFFAHTSARELNSDYAKCRNCRDLFYCRDDDFDYGNLRRRDLFFLSPIQSGKKEQLEENL